MLRMIEIILEDKSRGQTWNWDSSGIKFQSVLFYKIASGAEFCLWLQIVIEQIWRFCHDLLLSTYRQKNTILYLVITFVIPLSLFWDLQLLHTHGIAVIRILKMLHAAKHLTLHSLIFLYLYLLSEDLYLIWICICIHTCFFICVWIHICICTLCLVGDP